MTTSNTSNEDLGSKTASTASKGVGGKGRDKHTSRDRDNGSSRLADAGARFILVLTAVGSTVAIMTGVDYKWLDIETGKKDIEIARKDVVIASLDAELKRLKAEKAALETILANREDLPKPTIQQMLLERGGDYTWQWAGENWLGMFTFTPTGTSGTTFSVRATMNRVTKTSADGIANFTREQIWKTTTNGTAVIDGDMLRISGLKVMARNFEDVPGEHEVNFDVTLTPAFAFSGNVEYSVDSTDTSVRGGPGSISLVNGRVHQ